MPEYEFHLGRMICPARFRILHAENAAFRIVAVEIVDIYLPLASLFLEPSPGIRRPGKGGFPEYVAERTESLFIACGRIEFQHPVGEWAIFSLYVGLVLCNSDRA